MIVRSHFGLFLGLFCATAFGQSTIQDQFEMNLLVTDTPPGVWSYRFEGEPSNFFGPSPLAAKVGSLGLRNVDDAGGVGLGTANSLVREIGTDAGIAQQYVRFWFRGTGHNRISSAKIGSIDLAPLGLPAVEVYFEDKSLRLKFFNRLSADFTPYTETLAADGQWVLIEVFVTGVGTGNGTVALSLDGQLKSVSQGVDWTGQHLAELQLGNLYGQFDFRATLDFDSYRASATPGPSLLELVGPAVIAPGVCVPYAIQLRNSFDGGLAPAVADLVFSMIQTSDAGVLFSGSSTCAASSSGLRVDAGATGRLVFVRAAANERVLIGTRNADFPDFTLSVLVDGGPPDAGTPDAGTPDAGTPDAGTPDAGTPDAGTPDAGTPDAGTPDAGTPDAGTPDAGTPDAGTPDAGGPTTLNVGCSCGSPGGTALWALLGLLALVRYRPSRRA